MSDAGDAKKSCCRRYSRGDGPADLDLRLRYEDPKQDDGGGDLRFHHSNRRKWGLRAEPATIPDEEWAVTGMNALMPMSQTLVVMVLERSSMAVLDDGRRLPRHRVDSHERPVVVRGGLSGAADGGGPRLLLRSLTSGPKRKT